MRFFTWWVVRGLVVSLLAGALAVGFALIDPFGLDRAADRQSQQFLSRAIAPFYGGVVQRGQAAISIVMLDEVILQNLRDTGDEDWVWPPRFSKHADMLSEIAAQGAGPQAVMIDFLFAGDLGDQEGLHEYLYTIAALTRASEWTADPTCHASPAAKIACILKHQGQPVFMAKPSPLFHVRTAPPYGAQECQAIAGLQFQDIDPETGDATPRRIVDVQHAFDCVAVGTPVYHRALRNEYPLLIDYKIEAIEEAQLRGGAPDAVDLARLANDPSYARAQGVAAYDLSPAAAFFIVQLCRDAPSKCLPMDTAGRPGLSSASAAGPQGWIQENLDWFERSMVVQWGSRPPADFELFETLFRGPEAGARAAVTCRDEARAVGSFAAILGAQMIDGLGGGASAALRQPCPYFLEVPYDSIAALSADESQVQRDAEYRFKAEKAATAVGGRYVLIGGRFANSGDWVVSPVHGQSPGVHLHAMAFDNLLEWGPRRLREPGDALASIAAAGKSGPEGAAHGAVGLAALKFDWVEMIEFWVTAGLAFLGVAGRVAANSLRYHVTIDPSGPRRERMRGHEHALIWIGVLTLQFGLIAGALWAVIEVGRYAPANWLGLALLAPAATGLFQAERPRPSAGERTPAHGFIARCGEWLAVRLLAPLARYFRFADDRLGTHFRIARDDGDAQSALRRIEAVHARLRDLQDARERYAARLEEQVEIERRELQRLGGGTGVSDAGAPAGAAETATAAPPPRASFFLGRMFHRGPNDNA